MHLNIERGRWCVYADIDLIGQCDLDKPEQLLPLMLECYANEKSLTAFGAGTGLGVQFPEENGAPPGYPAERIAREAYEALREELGI